MKFPDSGKVLLSFSTPAKINLEIRPPGKDEKMFGLPLKTLFLDRYNFCIATTSMSPPIEIHEAFQAIDKNQLPSGCSKYAIEAEHRFFEIDPLSDIIIPYSILPDPFKKYTGEVMNLLITGLDRILRLLRWRYAYQGPPFPFSFINFQWSLDEQKWRSVPEAAIDTLYSLPVADIPADTSSEIESLISEEAREPVGHELLKEAYHLKEKSSRSALVIGIAALEVRIKELITNLAPDAQWLIENVQSPPIDNILKNYLPNLPVKNKIYGKVLPPPKSVMRILIKGIQMRNKIVHRGKGDIDDEFLDELFSAVQDVLWLLDYYSGFGWALDHIRPSTQAELD